MGAYRLVPMFAIFIGSISVFVVNTAQPGALRSVGWLCNRQSNEALITE
jgi:hypothetical protein